MIKHIGSLHTRTTISALTAKTATSTVLKPLLNFIIDTFGILKPLEVWNLQQIAKTAGMKTDPAPYIEISNNRIYVTGEVIYRDLTPEELKEAEGGLSINMKRNETNPCLRPGDIKPKTSALSKIGNAVTAPLRVMKRMSLGVGGVMAGMTKQAQMQRGM
jgi:hypothetical protein